MKAEGSDGQLDYRGLETASADIDHAFRFGNLGTCIAIGRGQSEKLHLDLHDDNKTYTVIMNCGEEGNGWERGEERGSLYLPTLGCYVPMDKGDVIFFEASCLPHKVMKLKEEDGERRVVMTVFTCGKLSEFVGHAPNLVVPYRKMFE